MKTILTCGVIKVVAVQLILKWGDPHSQHIFVFGRQKLSELCVISSLRMQQKSCVTTILKLCTDRTQLASYLHTPSQHSMKHMSSLFHEADVLRRGVGTLSVLYGVNKAVSELTP